MVIFIFQLMLRMGLIAPSTPGCFHYLPIALKALNKLCQLIDKHMIAIGGQKIEMPTLSAAELWKASGGCSVMPSFYYLFNFNKSFNEILSPPAQPQLVT